MKPKLLGAGAVFAAAVLMAGPALADPISATIAWIAQGLVLASPLAGTAAVIAEAVITFALTSSVAIGINKILAKRTRTGIQERQASVLELTLEEGPCEAIFGTVVTGGSLVDIYNWGPDYEHEMIVIAIAEHVCEEILGFYIGDKYYDWVEGAHTHADFTNPNGYKVLQCRNFFGWPGVPVPDYLYTTAPDRWTSADSCAGRHIVCFNYIVDDTVWAAGRPSFHIKVKGGRWYDPSKDSTVVGGSGPQRYSSPSTWTYSENAAVAEYNYRRGIWFNGQLLVGPGRSAEEAPPADIVANIAICNEAVSLKAGGTEPRYRVGCIVRSNEAYIDVIENFARAMGGEVVDRNGAVYAEPGYAKTPVAEFTDPEIVSGRPIEYETRLGRDDLVNIVVGRYVSPERLWKVTSTPVRRSSADITADGEPRDETLDLDFVTSPTQAQRCTEIFRRKSRLMKRAAVDLPHAFMQIEGGDWLEWTSDRRFAGGTVAFSILSADMDQAGNTRVALREMSSNVFAWNPAVDELDEERPAYLPAGAPPAAVIDGFDAEMVELTGVNGARPVGMKLTWTRPTDQSIIGITFEYRVAGSTVSHTVWEPNEKAGIKYIQFLTDGVDYECRAIPYTAKRNGAPTAWRSVLALKLKPKTPPDLIAFQAYQQMDGVVFKATRPAWAPAPELEVRAGANWATGRTIYRGVTFVTPAIRDPAPEDGSNRFWARTVAGNDWAQTYSVGARFVDLDVARLPNRNEVVVFDLQEDDWQGLTNGFTRTGISGAQTLNMDAPDGVRPPYADYFETVDIGTRVKATWYWRALIAGRDPSPPIAYLDLANLSYFDLESWYPYAVAEPVSDAQVVSYIAMDEVPADFVDGVTLDGASTTVNAVAAGTFTGVSYAQARRHQGGLIDEDSKAFWPVAIPATFRAAFDYRPDPVPVVDKVLYKAVSAGGDWLRVRYDAAAGELLAEDSDGGAVSVAAPLWDEDVTYSIALSQGGDERRIAWTYDGGAVVSATGTAGAMPAMAYAHLAGAAAISYPELALYDYADLAALSYADLGGADRNAEGVVADLAIYDVALTDSTVAAIGMRGPAGFTDYRTFDPADYIGRRAALWLRLNVDPGYGEPVRIDSAELVVDVADLSEDGLANILAAGTRINFTKNYVATAARPLPRVTATLTAGATAVGVKISGQDLTGFTAMAVNSSGAGVDASISWAAAGPGKGL